VFTDGVDGSSLLEGSEVVDVAARSGVTVFTVMLPDTSLSTTPLGTFITNAAGEDVLQRVSSATGGVYASISQNDQLGTSFVRAFDEFRTSYVLRYAATGTPKPGWHELSVRVTKNGRYDVRARKGYVGQ